MTTDPTPPMTPDPTPAISAQADSTPNILPDGYNSHAVEPETGANVAQEPGKAVGAEAAGTPLISAQAREAADAIDSALSTQAQGECLDSAFAEKPETKGGDETCATSVRRSSTELIPTPPNSPSVASPAPRQSDPDEGRGEKEPARGIPAGMDCAYPDPADAPEPEDHSPAGDTIAPGHNPDKLTVAQVDEGWRLLEADEKAGSNVIGLDGWACMSKEWIKCQPGSGSLWTGIAYRTRLTRAELRTARGLDRLEEKP